MREQPTDLVEASRTIVGLVDEVMASVRAESTSFDLESRWLRLPGGCADRPSDDHAQTHMDASASLSSDQDSQAVAASVQAVLSEAGWPVDVIEEDQGITVQSRRAGIGFVQVVYWTRGNEQRLAVNARMDCLPLPEGYERINDLQQDFFQLVDPDGERISR